MKTIVIIPTYNEKDNITMLLDRIFALQIQNLQVLVVDDNSPDGTGTLVQEKINTYPDKLFLLNRQGKLGLGSAYIAGFKWALDKGADLICEMDADGSHDPADLPRLIEAVTRGADVVIGSRKIKGGQTIGWGLHRHVASWGAMTVSRIILGIKTKDLTAGFRCYRKKVLIELDLSSITTNGYAFQEEMIWRCEQQGYQITEVPVIFKDRTHGQSKLSYKEIIEFFITLYKLKFGFAGNRHKTNEPPTN